MIGTGGGSIKFFRDRGGGGPGSKKKCPGQLPTKNFFVKKAWYRGGVKKYFLHLGLSQTGKPTSLDAEHVQHYHLLLGLPKLGFAKNLS